MVNIPDLGGDEVIESAAFQKVICEAISDHGMLAVDIAKKFDVTTGTIRRWQHGHNLPHAKVRAMIVAELEELKQAKH